MRVIRHLVYPLEPSHLTLTLAALAYELWMQSAIFEHAL